MSKLNILKPLLFLFILCLTLAPIKFDFKGTSSSDKFLTNIFSKRTAIAQDCSDEFIGNATINEVHKEKNNYYVEMKIPAIGSNITKSTYENWSIEINTKNKGPFTYSLNNADTSKAPWIVIDENQIGKQNYLDLTEMEILLLDSDNDAVDYLTIGGFSDELYQNCTFEYDTDMSSTKNKQTIARSPDGTGNWTATTNSTRGDSNPGDVELGNFNAFESSTESGNTTGPLYTKISGQEFQIDVVAIKNGEIDDNINNVDVKIVIVEDEVNTECSNLNTLTEPIEETFVNQDDGRITVSNLLYNNAIGRARIRITEDKNKKPAQGCSTDTFTIRPAYLTLNATDLNSTSPGINRVLDGNNSNNCQNETCHKAGYNFTLNGTALNSNNASVSTGYNATAEVGWKLNAPSDGRLGSFNPNSVIFDGSKFRTDNASYDEVGLVGLSLNDDGNFTAQSGDWDNKDCIRGSKSNTKKGNKYGCQTATQQNRTVGRFVPDRFQLSVNATGFGDGCTNSTYMGQPFPVNNSTPTITIEPINANNNTTQNYGDSFWKLSDDLINRYYINNAKINATLQISFLGHSENASLNDFDGYGNFTIENERLAYNKTNTKVQPFEANATLTIPASDMNDTDGVCYDPDNDNNCDPYRISSINGTELRYGRATVDNAYGSELLPLENIELRAEYYDEDSEFTTNTDDSCTVYNASDIVWSNATYGGEDNLSEDNLNATNENGDQVVNGVGYYTIHNSTSETEGPGKTGYVNYRFPVPAWLKFDWNDDGTRSNPPARATFGIYKGNEHIIYQQETTWK